MPQTNFITIGSLVRDGVLEHPGRDDARLSAWFKNAVRRKVTVRTKTALRQTGPFAVIPYFRLDKHLDVRSLQTGQQFYLIYDEKTKKYNQLMPA